MLCIYKHSHQTPAVILLLPIDKQRTACLSPLRNAKHLYRGGGGGGCGKLLMFCPLSSSSKLPRWVSLSTFLILHFCCCFVFMVGTMQCRFWLIKVWHLLLVIPSFPPLCFCMASFTWPWNCSSIFKEGKISVYLKLDCLDTDVFRWSSLLWKNFFFYTPFVQYKVSSVFGISFAH